MSTSVVRTPGRAIAVLAALAMVASMVVFAPAASADMHEPEVQRIAGPDRIGTAVEASQETFDTASDVIVAAGWNFPDALAAGGLAGVVDAPILLVNDVLDEATDTTLDELERLEAETVHIAGGTAAVSASIEAEIEAAGDWEVERFAGDDRFDTAALMADVFAAVDAEIPDDTAIVATGRDAADSLASGPLAQSGPHPILLTEVDELPATTAERLEDEDLGIENVLVLGGDAAVSDGVFADIEALVDGDVTRVSGPTRFETAIEIAAAAGFDESDEILVATGFGPDNVPADALAAAPYGGVNESPLLPVNDVLNELPSSIEDYVAERADIIDFITIFGGEAAVSAEIEAEIVAAATPPEPVTNQTFDVTPDEAATNPTGTERDYTASGIDADAEVEVALAAAGNVTVEDGIVSFEADDDDKAEIGDNDGVDASITETQGVTRTAGQPQVTTTADADGEVAFTITGDEEESVIPVVFVADDDGDLPLDEDGLPENDFGIGGTKTFVTEVNIEASPETDLNAVGTDHTVTVQFQNEAGEDIAAEGWDVDVLVSEEEADGNNGNYDNVASVDVIESATITSDADGEAEFTYTGPDEVDNDNGEETHYIYFRWQATGDFADANFPNAYDDVEKRWTDADPRADSVSLEPEESYNLLGENHTVTATVTDQFGDPLEGEDVDITVERDSNNGDVVHQVTRTTDGDGEVSFSYEGPSDDEADDTITASIDDEADEDEDTADKFWREGLVTNLDQDTVYDNFGDALDPAENDGDLEEGDTLVATGAFDLAGDSESIAVEGVTLEGDGVVVAEANFSIDADDVTIDGFAFEGAGDTPGQDRDSVVRINASAGVTISNNTFEGTDRVGDGEPQDGQSGIVTHGGASEGVILDNEFEGYLSSLFFNMNFDTFVVSDNVFEDGGVGTGLDLAGLDVELTGNQFVDAGNTSENDWWTGDTLATDDVFSVQINSAGVTMEGNTFQFVDLVDNGVYVAVFDDARPGYDLDAVLDANDFDPDAEVDARTYQDDDDAEVQADVIVPEDDNDNG